MAQDLHDSIRVVRCISPVSLGATGSGGKTGIVIDRDGFESVEFVVNVGSVTATNAAATLIIQEGDVTGTMTSIADASMIPNSGGELAASLVAGTPRTSGVLNTGKNFSARVGYIGAKRYVTAKLVPTISGAITAGVDVILGNPRKKPTAA